MENNQTPVTPPVDNSTQGQPAGNPSGNTTPPAVGNDQPSGGVNQNAQTVQVPVKEYNDLKRGAGRWGAHLKTNRENRRGNRQRSTSDYNTDDADPALLETLKDRDTKIDELSSVNVKLEVKDKVRDLLSSDDYKEIPQGIRNAMIRNPLGFATPNAHSVDEAMNDIQDYLDDELDNLATPAQGGDQPSGNSSVGTPSGQPPTGQQTPPASGSGPGNAQVDINQGVEGKTGSKRSVQVLQNILKGPRR